MCMRKKCNKDGGIKIKSEVKVVPEEKKSKLLAGGRSKAIRSDGIWTSSRKNPARYGSNDD